MSYEKASDCLITTKLSLQLVISNQLHCDSAFCLALLLQVKILDSLFAVSLSVLERHCLNEKLWKIDEMVKACECDNPCR